MRLPPPCPSSPNCVSSFEGTDQGHFISPLHYRGILEEAKARLLTVLNAMQRTRVVTDEPWYLHAECTSLVHRFIDDVEFWFHEHEPIIHVRSASRVGYWDLEVNRERIEYIRTRFQATSLPKL